MHVVVFDLVDPHRLERARAHVQGNESPLHTFGSNLFQQRFVKVQARSGRATAPARWAYTVW